MTKEDLSITYENNIFYCKKNNTKWISVDGEKWYGEEKRIVELEAQIEKMKCPQNCRYGSISVWCDNSISIDCEKEKFLHEENWCDFCKNCKKWEIKEK